MIKAKEIYKNFGELEVLAGVSFEVQQGEAISIIGPSGSGKSTLLRSLIGLEEINSGELYIEGISVKESGKKAYEKMGMVFQGFNLFPHKTVLGNLIEAPMVVKGEKKAKAEAKAETLLEKVGLSEKKDSYPAQLSGGQKQRVAIARALAMEPDIMLFDEPTSSLDPELVGEVLTVIRDLAEENITMLIVTHEMGFARDVSDRVFFMDHGKIISDTVPEKIFVNPGSERIQSFLTKILSQN
ncbi:MAG: amino acid ABC transporter ATP-binding protein [Halanaerobium sp.]|jgi:polar amino acid transport system ATP-binding protein|uniref:Amino acid ABC transporter ATP-binding protein (PAAT family) n=2 Tax=Halanaerobiaceae TaxID=972 RepID=A0A4R6SPP7_9FIRM|nr:MULTISPECIES: amino acid ABC transporter ATP-binding protein [Halanaerobium]PUU91145.1 MAG: amino acid ABC transporter ATP-binding protein [Halanaerobium sp.]PUU91848.1 MAG: amino acid ABC transporter ATP-binding protein [Halanaerobium sp.]TDQ06129.1 amino acid ABC transporter ATP-binding protein (PAAT family) [Halanaerobium saccharolyticum]